MEKNPADRFGTAQEMADDLRRYLNDEPIRARRPSVWHRARKWSQRHKALVRSAGLAALFSVAILAGSVGWVARDQAARNAALDGQVQTVLEEAVLRIEQARWSEAQAAVERADRLLAAAGRGERPAQFAELGKDLTMARRLEDIYNQPRDDDFLTGDGQDADYARAFREYGIDLTTLSAADAAARIRGRSIRRELARALDFWSISRRYAGNQGAPDWQQLLQIAKAADPDAWRDRLRDALTRGDAKALAALAESADVATLPPETLALLGRALAVYSTQDGKHRFFAPIFPIPLQPRSNYVVEFLKKAQRQYPGDLWLNTTLAAYCLHSVRLHGEAIRYYTVALALRPDSPYIANGMGLALDRSGAHRQSLGEFSKAIQLRPDYAEAFINRGEASMHLGQPDQGLADFSRAIELGCTWRQVKADRGWAYTQLRQWDKAIPDLSEAIDSNPKSAWMPRQHRIWCWSAVGQWEKAEADFIVQRAAYTALPEDDHWIQLGCLRLLQGDDAGYGELCERLCERAGLLKQGVTGRVAYMTSRTCLLKRDGNTPAPQLLAWAEAALASDPRAPWYLHTVALAHYRAGQFEEAVRCCRESEKADPKWRGTMVNQMLLAMAFQRLDRREDARQCLATAASWRKEVLDGTYKGQAGAPPDMHLSDWLAFEVLHREALGMFSR